MRDIPFDAMENSPHNTEMTWTDYATEEEAQILTAMRDRQKFFSVQRRLIYDRCRKRMNKDRPAQIETSNENGPKLRANGERGLTSSDERIA